MKRWKTKLVFLLSLVLVVGSLTSCGNVNSESENVTDITSPKGNDYKVETEEMIVSKSQLRDKVMGGWIGHVIGLGSGFEYVCDDDGQPMIAIDDKYWEPEGQVCSGTLGANPLQLGPYDETYQRVSQGMVKSDDDILVDVFNQSIFDEYGPNVGYYELSKAWKDHKIGDSAGGEDAMKLIETNDYIAPYVGQFAYGNTLYTATEPWIENETLGLMFPYMPVSAESTADVFTTITGDAYGLYLGKLCAIAYSYAMTENDARVALEKAFTHMEESNMIYDAYQYVLECYETNPDDWRTCATGLVERTLGDNLMGYNVQIDLYVNAGYIFLGIIFGENDFEQSIKISSLAGYDGDCTTATVGGLVGTVKGFENLPEKYKQYLNGESVFVNDTTWFSRVGSNYPAKQTFNEIVDLTMSNMEEQITANGGSVNGDNYQIQKQNYTGKIQTVIPNYGFETQTTDSWKIEGEGELSLSGILHTGNYGGEISIKDTSKDVKVFQNLELVEGDYYQAVIYVSTKIGKEFRIFAEDEKKYFYASYNTPVISSDRFIRAELTFCASSESMNIGIHVPGQTDDGDMLYFDDMFLANVSHKIAREGQCFQAEAAEVTKNVTAVKKDTASGEKVISLQKDDAVRFTVQGTDECYQELRLYYSHKENFIATLKVVVDGEKTFQLPLVSQGETSDFNSQTYADFGMFLGEGEHQIVFKLVSDNNIEIDKLEVRMGDISLRP